MIEHSVISEWLPLELRLLAEGIDPDRQRFLEDIFVWDEDKANKAVAYYDYAKTVRDLHQDGMGLEAAVQMAAKRHGVTARTIRNARRYMKGMRGLGAEK
jgi:hypothetical protein